MATILDTRCRLRRKRSIVFDNADEDSTDMDGSAQDSNGTGGPEDPEEYARVVRTVAGNVTYLRLTGLHHFTEYEIMVGGSTRAHLCLRARQTVSVGAGVSRPQRGGHLALLDGEQGGGGRRARDHRAHGWHPYARRMLLRRRSIVASADDEDSINASAIRVERPSPYLRRPSNGNDTREPADERSTLLVHFVPPEAPNGHVLSYTVQRVCEGGGCRR